MVKGKNKLKQKKVINEDITNIRNLIILLIIVILICIGLYFFTDSMIKRDNKVDDTKSEVNINYDTATVGTMFNRVEDEYYVILYSSEDDGSSLDSVVATYRSSDNYIATYFIDLDKKINNNVLGDELIKNPKNSSEVKVKGATLYKIKNGKVINCYSGVDNIIEILK